MSKRRFQEFFAGGGMVRAALQPLGWECVFANDFDFKKAAAYRINWESQGACDELQVADVSTLDSSDIPSADLAWGSFPCQDLSLAGNRAGLSGARSGTFYPFWNIIAGLMAESRAPKIIAVENVAGTLSSSDGGDFRAIVEAFVGSGYRPGALVIDAALFVPQSRPRLFIVGVHESVEIPTGLLSPGPVEPFHTSAIRKAEHGLEPRLRDQWVWWNLPTPARRLALFSDLIEESPDSIDWHTPQETAGILAMMSPVNAAKVEAATRAGRRMVGGVYKRTRQDANGKKVQRAEVRFDDVAGCLRTPAGGSSRQLILVVEGKKIRSRLLSSRETARLMGLDDNYKLPRRYNEAYHLTGDGVVVPVVRHLALHLFEPVLSGRVQQSAVQQLQLVASA